MSLCVLACSWNSRQKCKWEETCYEVKDSLSVSPRIILLNTVWFGGAFVVYLVILICFIKDVKSLSIVSNNLPLLVALYP